MPGPITERSHGPEAPRWPALASFLSSPRGDDHIPFRAVVLFGSVLAGIVLVGILSYLIPAGDDSIAADLLLDRNTRIFPYPFTIQNVMWIVFCTAAGELLVRSLAGGRERAQMALQLLPENDDVAFRPQELEAMHRRVSESDPGRQYMLQRFLSSALLQFKANGSIQQVNSTINLSMDLYQHEIELRYNVVRYLVWLIPTLGFVGTVMGIAFALRTAGTLFATTSLAATTMGPDMMQTLTGDLGVAFYTTLLALLQAAVLMLALHLTQEKEEGALNQVGQYCIRHFVSRLSEQPERSGQPKASPRPRPATK